jgi:hypothetical protein
VSLPYVSQLIGQKIHGAAGREVFIAAITTAATPSRWMQIVGRTTFDYPTDRFVCQACGKRGAEVAELFARPARVLVIRCRGPRFVERGNGRFCFDRPKEGIPRLPRLCGQARRDNKRTEKRLFLPITPHFRQL